MPRNYFAFLSNTTQHKPRKQALRALHLVYFEDASDPFCCFPCIPVYILSLDNEGLSPSLIPIPPIL